LIICHFHDSFESFERFALGVAQNRISTHYLLDKLKVHDLCFVTIGDKWKSLHEVDDGLFSNKAALVVEVYKLAVCAD
jgi:hypothetical protein